MTFFSLIANKQSGLVDNASVLESIARKWSRVRIYLHPFFGIFFYSFNLIDFVDELVNEAINKLADKNIDKDQKAIFIEKVALENVDINALGLYTLGELRKSSNEEDLSSYQKAFEKYVGKETLWVGFSTTFLNTLIWIFTIRLIRITLDYCIMINRQISPL